MDCMQTVGLYETDTKNAIGQWAHTNIQKQKNILKQFKMQINYIKLSKSYSCKR